jgi:hypothetical protein
MAPRKKSTSDITEQAKVIDGAVLGPTDTLVGSNILPSLVDVGGEQAIPLGDVVKAAHALSGLSVEAWNALPDDERETLLASAVEGLKGAVGAAASNLTANTEGASTAGAPAGEPNGSAEGGAAEPAPLEAGAAPAIVQTPVVAASTVTAFLKSPVRFGGKKRLPGRPVEMPAELFVALQAKGLIEEDD